MIDIENFVIAFIVNQTGQNGTTNAGNYRRNCNVPMAFYDSPPIGTPSRLSIHPATDIYDPEMTTCCLPPPSPAPNSDRFIAIQVKIQNAIFSYFSI